MRLRPDQDHGRETNGASPPVMHMIRLAVGIRDLDHLCAAQAARRFVRDDQPFVSSITRHRPSRIDPGRDASSLYWVIKGVIRCRQRLRAFDATLDPAGRPACALIMDPVLIAVRPDQRRPFQGWRYLPSADAPPDLDAVGGAPSALPAMLLAELRALGLA